MVPVPEDRLSDLCAAIVIFPLKVFVPVDVENVPEPLNEKLGFVEVFPNTILVAEVFPRLRAAAPPVSTVIAFAPFD